MHLWGTAEYTVEAKEEREKGGPLRKGKTSAFQKAS